MLFIAMIALGVKLATAVPAAAPLIAFIVFALVFGVLMVLPIGGADMPVVISLLNSFTGLAVAADGLTPSTMSAEESQRSTARHRRCAFRDRRRPASQRG